MKNILFYMTRFPGFGGIESVTEIIGLELLKSKYTISILTHIRQEKSSELLKYASYYLMPDRDEWNSNANVIFAQNIIVQKQFDAIIYQDSYAPTADLVCNLSKKFNLPLFVFEHNTPLYIQKSRQFNRSNSFIVNLRRDFISYPIEDWVMRNRRRLLYDCCKKYVLLSKSYIPEFCKVANLNDKYDKLTYINNPLLGNQSEMDINLKNNIIIFVGRLEKVKRVDEMLHVWSLLQHQFADWTFLIIGDGSERTKLESLAIELELERIEFKGYQSPKSYFEQAKLFLMTSVYEGWPMSLLESMLYGCNVVAYDSYSSLYDILDSETNGFIVENNNRKTFVEICSRVMNDEKLRNKIAVNGQMNCTKYNIEVIVKKWVELLEN